MDLVGVATAAATASSSSTTTTTMSNRPRSRSRKRRNQTFLGVYPPAPGHCWCGCRQKHKRARFDLAADHRFDSVSVHQGMGTSNFLVVLTFLGDFWVRGHCRALDGRRITRSALRLLAARWGQYANWGSRQSSRFGHAGRMNLLVTRTNMMMWSRALLRVVVVQLADKVRPTCQYHEASKRKVGEMQCVIMTR